MERDLAGQMDTRAEIIGHIFLFRRFDGRTIENIEAMVVIVRFKDEIAIFRQGEGDLAILFHGCDAFGIGLEQNLLMRAGCGHRQCDGFIADKADKGCRLRLRDGTLIAGPNAVKWISRDAAGVNGDLFPTDIYAKILGHGQGKNVMRKSGTGKHK